MKKISFILPVYNVEKYLRECFDSINEQVNNDCEIVLVDDGATDHSSVICDELQKNNKNVKVIHKENGGLASARNAGLAEAEGDYISFVDSDDRIATGSVQKILEAIDSQDFDLCFMAGIKVYEDGKTKDLGDSIDSSMIIGKNKTEVLDYIASRPKFSGSSCTKIFKREFLTRYNLQFPHDKRQSEDLGFVRDCIILGEKYYAINYPFYEYRQNRVGSITNGASERAVKGLLVFIEETVQRYSEQKKSKKPYGNIALSFAAYEYFVALLNYALLTNIEEKERLCRELRGLQWVTGYTLSPRFKILKNVLKIFGINITSKMISMLYRLR